MTPPARRDGLFRFGKRPSRFERLEQRTVFASLAGSVWIDQNGDSTADSADQPVSSALVWIDSNRNGSVDAGEPQTRSDASGNYAFADLPAGDYEIRMQPTPGLFQTSPAQYFAFQKNNVTQLFGLAEIDPATGAVTQLTPQASRLEFGLIKTIQGEFYAAGHVSDSLFRINPITGDQVFIGYSGKGLAGGLAYDPFSDRLFTLDLEDGPDSPLTLYEIDRHTAQLTRVGNGQGLTDVRGTSALTFDLVNREVILFDNALNDLIAYDLDGNGRRISRFATPTAFYNLAFDGHRFLTIQSGGSSPAIFEVDIHNAKLTALRGLDKSLSFEAAEILAVNEANRVKLESEASAVTGLTFLTNQMNVTQGVLQIDATKLRLVSTEKHLDVETALGSAGEPVKFCVGALATDLTIDQTLTGPGAVQVQTSPQDDRVTMSAAPLIDIDMGDGRDTLAFTGPQQLKLADIAARVSDVEIIDLSGAGAVNLVADVASIKVLAGPAPLTIVTSSEDRVELDNNKTWRSSAPVVQAGRRLHQLAVDDVIVNLNDGLGWTNPLEATDVSHDGFVSALDALLVINLLNTAGSRALSTSDAAVTTADYVDANADNILSPIDALLVINRINELLTT